MNLKSCYSRIQFRYAYAETSLSILDFDFTSEIDITLALDKSGIPSLGFLATGQIVIEIRMRFSINSGTSWRTIRRSFVSPVEAMNIVRLIIFTSCHAID